MFQEWGIIFQSKRFICYTLKNTYSKKYFVAEVTTLSESKGLICFYTVRWYGNFTFLLRRVKKYKNLIQNLNNHNPQDKFKLFEFGRYLSEKQKITEQRRH